MTARAPTAVRAAAAVPVRLELGRARTRSGEPGGGVAGLGGGDAALFGFGACTDEARDSVANFGEQAGGDSERRSARGGEPGLGDGAGAELAAGGDRSGDAVAEALEDGGGDAGGDQAGCGGAGFGDESGAGGYASGGCACCGAAGFDEEAGARAVGVGGCDSVAAAGMDACLCGEPCAASGGVARLGVERGPERDPVAVGSCGGVAGLGEDGCRGA